MVICGHVDEADDLADDIELFISRRRPEMSAAAGIGRTSLGAVSPEQVSNRLRLVAKYAAGGKGFPKIRH